MHAALLDFNGHKTTVYALFLRCWNRRDETSDPFFRDSSDNVYRNGKPTVPDDYIKEKNRVVIVRASLFIYGKLSVLIVKNNAFALSKLPFYVKMLFLSKRKQYITIKVRWNTNVSFENSSTRRVWDESRCAKIPLDTVNHRQSLNV